jgi:hypothetical protein
MSFHFGDGRGRREKHCPLPEPAWGLSRYAFDALLLNAAEQHGALILRESDEPAQIVATGRAISAKQRGARLFGFKAHFAGPANDAVELYFFGRCYVGVNAIEGGGTNVCGLAPEDFLRKFNFDYDAVVRNSPALAERIAPLARSTQWYSTGPLEFAQSFGDGNQYLAGDALSFVDPFTGSGLLAAVKSGALAGESVCRSVSVQDYCAACRAMLRRPFEVAGLIRAAVDRGWADSLAKWVPGKLLFQLTRPLS